MSNKIVQVAGYNFDGPHQIANTSFNEVAGIYLITDSNGNVIDVGETENLKNRIANHERASCWSRNSGNTLWFHHESSQNNRLYREGVLRNLYNPACGVK